MITRDLVQSQTILRDGARIIIIQVLPKVRLFLENFVNIFYEMEI